MKTLVGMLALTALCSVAAPPIAAAPAQESVNYASISGRVIDPQGAVVAGAQVVVRQTDTNVRSEVATDAEGRFRFPYLRVGPYIVTVNQPGFSEATRRLTLTIGAAFDLPIPLSVQPIAESVTITAQATVLEAARTQTAGTISQSEVRAVPLNGRNFLDLALLVPGVSPTNVGTTQFFPETSAVPGGGLSIGSQRNFSNTFIIDGLSANDDAAGLSGMPAAVDAVEEFQVVTAGAQAELGRALGGYISVVTKSGTNTTRADIYGFFRDDRFNAANALTGTTLPMDQQQYGGSLGGPIKQNRLFYFANVERRHLDQSGLVTIAPLTVAGINSRLATVGYPGQPVTSGLYPNPVRTTNIIGKVDYLPSGRDQMSVRYAQYGATSANARGAGGLAAPSGSSALDNVDRTLAFGNTLSLTGTTVNETRLQVSRGNLQAPPTDLIGPAVTIQGVATFGTLSTAPTARENAFFEIVNNLSHQVGAHALRAGFDFLFNDDSITFPRAVRGTYTFSSLANFLGGTYNNAGFGQTFGANRVAQTNPNLGVYVQDEWKAGSNLTVNAGLRYDLQFLETIRTDADNLAPRLGLAWTPTASRRTIVRANGGLFFDRLPLRALANALLSAGNTTDLNALRQISVSLSPAQTNAPVFPAILPSVVPSGALVNFTTMDRNIQNAFSRQIGIEAEQQIGTRTTVSAGYQYVRGEHLVMQINQNVPSCVAAGSNNGCRPNPAYANNNQYSSAGTSRYHGLHLSLVQRPTDWGSFRVSYTLSKAMDNVGEFFFSAPIDPFDLAKDWGRSDDDQRHRLVVNGTVGAPATPARTAWEHVTHGTQLSVVMQYYSSLPLNITSGVTTVQGTAGRPVVAGAFISRNAGAGPDFFGVNARISRTFRTGTRATIEGLVEGFNLTNRRNVVTMNGNFGAGAYPANPASTFGQATGVAEPRALQLGVRVNF